MTRLEKKYIKTKNEIRKLEKLQDKADNRHTNHILHLLLSLVTFGLWLPIWLLASLNFTIGSHNYKIEKLHERIFQIELEMKKAA